MKAQMSSVIGLMLMMMLNSASAQEPLRIIVLPLDTLHGASMKDASFLSNELAKAISRIGRYDVMTRSRSELERVFEEHGKATPAVLDESTKKELGTWLKVDFVIGGTLAKSEAKRHAISLEMVDVRKGKVVSTARLAVMDFSPRLLLNRLAQLLLWARLRMVCERVACESMLNGKLLREEMMDPDYNVWLVEPGKKHILEVRAKKENYTTYKEEMALDVAELRVVQPVLKHRVGILDVRTTPEAKVYLNDEMIGTTNLRKDVQAGKYKLVLAAGRHHDVEKEIIISPEETTFVYEVLPANYSSYRRNGIISAVAAALCVGSGLYASSQANKAYDRYLETMSVNEMRDQRDKSKTFDIVSYVSYGAAGAFAIWSILEWIGLITSPEPSETMTKLNNDNRLNLSLSNRGLTLTFDLY